MPRKAKDKIIENDINNEDNAKKVGLKKTSKKASSASTVTKTGKKSNITKSSEKNKKVKEAEKKTSTTTAKTAKKTEKKTSTTTVKTSKKNEKKASSSTAKTSKKIEKKTSASTAKTSKKTEKKTSASTTKSSKKSTEKKQTTTKKRSSKKAEDVLTTDINILEYYDLPYKYGNTIVKLLAQTPKTLFVYWEISDKDIDDFKKQYGENFFDITTPILIVHNLTLNKTSEIEINDFANCWYLNTEDTNCKFDIELARKFINHTYAVSKNNNNDYLYVAKSNDLQSPNDHILFEKLTDVVIFKNYETNETVSKHIDSFKFLKDIYKFYQDMYSDELLKNPSSNFGTF